MKKLTLDVGCGAFPQGDVNVDIDLKTRFHHPYILCITS